MADFGIGETMMAVSAMTAAASTVAASQQARAQAATIQAQSQLRANQTRAVAGQQMEQAAMKARQQEAQSLAAASGAGINVGSNSFMASMQTTNMNQANESGLILENEQNQQQANVAETQSLLNSEASSPSAVGGMVDVGLAGAGGYMQGTYAYSQGANKPTPNSSTIW
jgi:hypothetical protein